VEKKILRVLIIDDSPDDAELAVAALRRDGYILKTQRVQDFAATQAALESGKWDLTLCEFDLPYFGAGLALDLFKRAGQDNPFIVLARSIPDTEMAKIMRSGAHDVILKGQLARLVPAVERERRAAQERDALRISLQALKEIETKHRAMVEGSREAIGYIQDGMHIGANKAYLDIFGYQSLNEIEGVPVMNLFEKAEHPRFKEFSRKLAGNDGSQSMEFVALKNDGSRIHVETALSPVVIDGEQCTQIVVADVSKRKAVESKLQYLSQHDPLTSLFNRHHFIQELDKALIRAKQGSSASGLIYIDLDDLKSINDSFGHAAGDRLLIKMARLFRETLGEDTLLSRFGSDEFVALTRDKDEKSLKHRAEALQKVLKDASFSEGGKTFKCACKLGLALVGQNSGTGQNVLAAARRASEPPGGRKSQTAAIDPEQDAPKSEVSTKQTEPDWDELLRTALDRDGFQLIYQPIMNLHGEAAEYFEVLVRMLGDNDDLIFARKFMPVAEKSGKGIEIDRWVVRQAIKSLAELHREGRHATFFINVCASAFSDTELIPLIQKASREARLDKKSLVFEADEATISAHSASARTFASAAAKIGCRFAVDNFGVGRGGMEHLRDLPFDFIKIDGSLIRNLATDNVSRTSLKAIVDVAKAMNKRTIAKSVEAADNLAVLWNLQVDYVQGHYFQPGDVDSSYEYTDESTLASDPTVPRWAHTPTKR
jgi:diguanylate cyclase (GGDEF)-like protein/PAS domain S-box-containing protein